MTRPLVTVCVPTTGRLTYIEAALATLDAQTYPNVEILFLDNASPPAMQEVLGAFVATHPEARVLRVDERVPMFANFNRGVRAARGEYLAFFHDDDVYDPQFLERLVTLLEAHPGAGMAAGNYDVIDGSGAVIRRNRHVPTTGLWPGSRFIEFVMTQGRAPVSTPGIVFRRAAFSGFDESIPINWGDFTIFMRLAERHDVAMEHEVLYAWRVHGGNASQIMSSVSIPLRTEVLLSYAAEYATRHPGDPAAAGMRASAARTHLAGLLWGWMSAAEDDDARECRRLAGTASRSGAVLAAAMGIAERLGLSLARRRALLPAVRRVALSVLGPRATRSSSVSAGP